MEKVLKDFEKYILYSIIFLLPVGVLGLSSNPFVIGKLEILFYGLSLLLILKSIRTMITGKLDFSVSSYDLPLLLILITYVVSTIFKTTNKMEAILLPGTSTAVVGGILLYFFINQLEDKSKDSVVKLLTLTAGIYSVWMLIAISGLLSSLPLAPYLKSKFFTPDGGYLPSAIFLATALIITFGSLMAEKNFIKKVLTGVASFFVISAFAVCVFNLLPGKPGYPRFPSFGTSWSIAVDSLKASPVLGVGPGNYLTAFNRFRPLSYNNTDLWAIKFSTANNFYLTVLTEVGLLGFAGYAMLLYKVFSRSKKEFKEKKLVNWGFAGMANFVSLIALILALLFFPATNFLIIFFFILLALITKAKRTRLNLVAESHDDNNASSKISSNFPAFLVSLPVLIAVGFLLFRSINIVRAEYKFKKSADALAKNEAKTVYEVMKDTINLNPRVDRYRAAYSKINLLLANAVVKKKDLTDEEKKTLTGLVQVAIAEAKQNVVLNPLRADNWEVLGSTYRSIMPVAQDMDKYAIQSYRQAIVLDPFNPNLRIALGGIYYARKDYDSAIGIFRTVTDQIKTDHPNAHYNLAFAYKEKGLLDNAIAEMTMVISLVDRNSKDYEAAQKALADFQNKKKADAPKGDQLNPPQPDEKTVKDPVDLPADSEPPDAPAISVTPTPTGSALTPTLTVTATPTPTQ